MSPFEMAIERHVIHTLGTRPCWEEGWRRQIRATNSESPFQTSWRIGGAVAHGAVGRPVHRVCLRGLRSTRLHDSIPPVDCHGNQVKPVIQVPRNFLVLWFQGGNPGPKRRQIGAEEFNHRRDARDVFAGGAADGAGLEDGATAEFLALLDGSSRAVACSRTRRAYSATVFTPE